MSYVVIQTPREIAVVINSIEGLRRLPYKKEIKRSMVIKFLQKSAIYPPFNLSIILTGLILLCELNYVTLVVSHLNQDWISYILCFVYTGSLGIAINIRIMLTSYTVIYFVTKSLDNDLFLRQIHIERHVSFQKACRSRANIKILTKCLVTHRDIRIKFGPNNCYERETAENILGFVIVHMSFVALIL